MPCEPPAAMPPWHLRFLARLVRVLGGRAIWAGAGPVAERLHLRLLGVSLTMSTAREPYYPDSIPLPLNPGRIRQALVVCAAVDDPIKEAARALPTPEHATAWLVARFKVYDLPEDTETLMAWARADLAGHAIARKLHEARIRAAGEWYEGPDF